MKKFPLTPALKRFASHFTQAGFSLYIVGGSVRDFYLGRKISDYDFTSDALPSEVKKLFRRVLPTGIEHGTVTVLFEHHSFEVTTFRVDGTYSDFRRPDSVTFARSLEDDLKRRDFTINALAIELPSGTLIDLHNGIGDLNKKVIRAIGEPSKRFGEDALRILRACRFSSQLSFTIDDETKKAMGELSHNLLHISAERIRIELMKIVESPKPSVGFLAMRECKALEHLLPELAQTEGLEQGYNHSYDLFYHLLYACDAVSQKRSLVRLAALLHDVGKVETKRVTQEGFFTFYNHEIVSEKIAKKLLVRLKFSNNEQAVLLNLIRNHMFNYSSEWSDGAVRRFINRVGLENIDDLFELRRADRLAINGSTYSEDLIELKDRIALVLQKSSALTRKELALNGDDLMKEGIPKGPIIGELLNELLETVLDDPSQNRKEQLLTIARNLYNQRVK